MRGRKRQGENGIKHTKNLIFFSHNTLQTKRIINMSSLHNNCRNVSRNVCSIMYID